MSAELLARVHPTMLEEKSREEPGKAIKKWRGSRQADRWKEGSLKFAYSSSGLWLILLMVLVSKAESLLYSTTTPSA